MSLLPIIRSVFSRWTALQIAVTHSMGGYESEEKYEAFIHAFGEYLTRSIRSLSSSQTIYECDIQEYLDEILDEEFNTVLDDGSSFELAKLFVRYINLISQGKLNEIEQELQYQQTIHSSVQMSVRNKTNDDEESSSSDDDDEEEKETVEEKPKTQSMDIDEDGWTTVHRKK